MPASRVRAARKGVTLIEVMIAMIVGSILLAGMSIVLVTLFVGMRESRDFAVATQRIDLIRQLTFDGRTGNSIVFPDTDGLPGDYTSGGLEGDQVMFNAIDFDPVADTTTNVTITWESRRPAASTDPYQVVRFIDTTPEAVPDPTDDVLTFSELDITEFDITRTASNGFFVRITTAENNEQVEIELAVTLRNVIN